MNDQPLPSGSERRATILILDDEVLVRLVIADYLRSCDYKVIEAATTDEALAVLKEGVLPVDIVLTVIELSGTMDGFAFARWIRTHRPLVKVILVATIEKASAVAADLCHDGPVLTKPYDQRTVLDRIKRLLASFGS